MLALHYRAAGMRQPITHRIAVEGAEICVFEWPAADTECRTVLLAHATGFHARCWDQIVHRLPDCRVLAVDQRGHGRSSGEQPVHWRQFGDDLAAIARHFDLQDLEGVGHSMGGHAMVQAATSEADRFRRLLLIDPVILPPEWYGTSEIWPDEAVTQHPTAKRRRHWQSAREMYERFEHRVPFDTWDHHVLRDYCEHGLEPDPEHGAYRLACHPEFEAAVYMASRGNAAIHDCVKSVQAPVLLIRAMEPPDLRSLMDFRYSPTWKELAAAFPNGREIYLPDRTHFLPMESPELVAQWIEAAS